MAKKFGFFNSINGDRKYLASDISQAFDIGITTGLKAEEGNLKVTSHEGMQVQIQPGSAMIFGHFFMNDEPEIITIDTADAELNRIDRVVVRYDAYTREVNTTVIKGSPALSPTPPARLETPEQFDLVLADIYVPAAATVINASNITDMRDSELCGYIGVKGAVTKFEFESHLADYAKGTMIRIILKISANSGNGVVDYQLGGEYVQSVVSSAYGIDINLKNIPTNAKLSSSFVITSSEGLSIGGSDINPFIYQRALSNTALQLGIKNSPTSGHRPWNNVAAGAIQVTIAW